MIEQGDGDIWEMQKKKYKVGDNTIKTKCQTPEWGDAYILLMIENYKDSPVTSNASIGDDDDDLNLNTLLFKNFEFTKNKYDFVTTKEIKQWIIDMKINASFGKVKTELMAEGCKESRKDNKRGFCCIKRIIKVDVINDVSL
jgi:hypothetical protein